MKRPDPPLAALLGRGATYGGDLSFEGRVRIDGAFTGKIYTDDTLEIGELGSVEGEIDAAVLIVAGTVRGTIHVRDRLLLQPTAVVIAQVDALSLDVRPGARLDATLKVGS